MAHPSDRATRASHQAATRLDHSAGIPCAELAPADVEVGALEMLARDHARMRLAGGNLAEAAIRVIHDYDGLHRLSLAVAGWAEAIAAEGDRGPVPKQEQDIEQRICAIEEMVWPLGR